MKTKQHEHAIKERPVLFQTPMVQAILKGRKTMTRRARKLGNVGDVLWVRETFGWNTNYIEGYEPIFKADGLNDLDEIKWKPSIFMPKRICRLHLRITALRQEPLKDISIADAIKEGIHCLAVTKTTENDDIEHYHWLPLKDYWTRGVNLDECFYLPVYAFLVLWESINGKGSTNENPMVWVHEFEVLRNYE